MDKVCKNSKKIHLSFSKLMWLWHTPVENAKKGIWCSSKSWTLYHHWRDWHQIDRVSWRV